MHPALFYRPGDRLTLPELSAARLDGDVVEVGEGYMPADTIEGAGARALSLSPLVPTGAAVSGISAAWVHGARDAPPGVHHVSRISRTRQRVVISSRVVHHERRLPEDEVQEIAGVWVQNPLATAVSLLFSSAGSAEDTIWLRALIDAAPGLADAVRERVLPLGRRPGANHARRVLDGWADQDVVTRYTS
ncbi:SAM-dependent methyltransferase [Microbacterium esteraromaticum]|uniref:SAM-dependent methyltransferase n=1 Tax=Microbacterium esteraromaticum TaxID=57043 RepID=A0A7D8AMW4_9MICO|nr:SAM-dependent methyltransferase [Microbacterium esteraromaticum]QMU98188.1 SAM-dependent methyltransferase [Microbacterium esteraromaticum]